jgi:membrane-bound lytic murein transglycosylase D
MSVMKKKSLAVVFISGMLSMALILLIFGFGDDVKTNKKAAESGVGSAPMSTPSLPKTMDFPEIEAELKANNMPDDFKYLCIAESNLQNLVSRVGASGFWQFMKGTAPGYELEVSETVDERYHVAKSTAAACAYLKTAYQRFGNWTAAAASYNCGMGGYNSRATFQKTNYYYDLVLPEETQRYIFRILAFKHLLNNADSLGFKLPEQDRYLPVKTRSVAVNRNLPNLDAFAKENGSSYKMLKLLNPWLRERSLKVKAGKTYQLLLPAT